jgi:hypothetical protein
LISGFCRVVLMMSSFLGWEWTERLRRRGGEAEMPLASNL